MGKNVGIFRDNIICIVDTKISSEDNNKLIEDLNSGKKIFSTKSSVINSLIVTDNNGYAYLVREDTENLRRKLNNNFFYDF
jgi:hypothetical protein